MKTAFTVITALALLLALASPAWAQTTTYASPVKIMNTPVPVNGTVTVTPQGGTMPVNGSVGITGTPQVAISGTPTVSLSGTPTVALSSSANTVQLAGTPFVRSGDMTLPANFIGMSGTVFSLPGSSTDTVEIESVSAYCILTPGAKPALTRLWFVPPGGTIDFHYSFPLTFIGTVDATIDEDVWSASSATKIYARGGSNLKWQLTRAVNAATEPTCTVTVNGRVL